MVEAWRPPHAWIVLRIGQSCDAYLCLVDAKIIARSLGGGKNGGW